MSSGETAVPDGDAPPRICAVVVTYHPDAAPLKSLLEVAAPQVGHVLVIANDGTELPCSLPENGTLLKQEENLGLGAAYNIAARSAAAQGASHLLLLDQDSLPEPGMVAALLKAVTATPDAAAAGPLWRDSRTGADGFFVRFSRYGVRKFTPTADEIVPVDFLISAGSLIPLRAFADIGPFDETLFIDHIDTEWSLRARAKGYRLYGIAQARISQAFGEETLVSTILGARRSLYLYPPQRNYYLLRNSIRLWRRPYAPWRWIIHDVRRILLLMGFYGLRVPPRRIRLNWMLRAIRDGFRRN